VLIAMADSCEDKHVASFTVTAWYLLIFYELTKKVSANWPVTYRSVACKVVALPLATKISTSLHISEF
jgi:hypothetical protein